jgi:hypothetical protein
MIRKRVTGHRNLRRAACLAITLAGWLGCASCCSAEDGGGKLEPLIRQLVGQLSSSRQVDRAVAVRELEALGPVVLPHLPSSDAVDDPGVRDALVRLRRVLEKRLVVESTQAARVTLTGTQPVSEVVTAIAMQTKNRLALAEDIQPKALFEATWDQVPFWDAVNDLGHKFPWQPRWNPASLAWELSPQTKNGDIAVAVSGPFRIVVQNVAWKSLPNSTDRLLRATLAIQAEPRLRPLFMTVSPGEWSGKLATQSLAAWNPAAEYELPFGDGSREVVWTLDLLVPTAPDKSSRWSLKGACRVHLAAGSESFVFDAARLPRGSSQRRGDVAVRLQPTTFVPQADGHHAVTVRLTVGYARGGPAFESHRVGMFHRAARLETAGEQKIPFRGFEVVAEADGGVALEFRFDGLTEPPASYHFIYEAPTLLLDVPVNVAFPEIPTPAP